MTWLMMIFMVIGGLICLLNFYLSVLHYPIHRIRSGKKEEYNRVSGIPIIRSLLVALSLIKLWQPTWLLITAIVMILIDTGGLRWFVGVMLWQRCSDTGKGCNGEI